MQVRKMLVSDLPAILPVQAECYYDITPESATCLGAKINASPQTCFVCIDEEGKAAGYVIAMPIMRFNPPLLDAPVCNIPQKPNCLYLHDMAVSNRCRGLGVGELLYQAMKEAFHTQGFEYASLVAIQGAKTYWKKYGFKSVEVEGELAKNVASYGADARYMELYKPKTQQENI